LDGLAGANSFLSGAAMKIHDLQSPQQCVFVKRLGMTLVELLVTISIIGAVVAISLPAVQQAREAARRMSCLNNLKQIGLALHGYHDAHRRLPVSIAPWGLGASDITQHNGKGWIVGILPHLEQRSLYDSLSPGFDGDFLSGGGIMNPVVRGAMQTRVPVLNCPSDGSVQRLSADQYQWTGIDVALTSYKGVLGDNVTGLPLTIHAGSLPECYFFGGCNGLFWRVTYREPQAFDGIADGMSNTLMVGEDVASQINQSVAFYANGDWATCHTPLNHFVNPSRPDDWWNVIGFRSHHVGGAHFCLADGSVRFLSEAVDQSLYRRLSTRAGGEVTQSP